MDNAELTRVDARLEKACVPEEVFGKLQAGTTAQRLAAARKVFLRLARTVHPDVYEEAADVARAGSAFKKLARFWEEAQAKIEAGTYGVADATTGFRPFVIQTAHCRYTLERLLTRGDLCNLYVGTASSAAGKRRVLLKVAIQPQDNYLVVHEASILRHLSAQENYPTVRHFLSQFVDTFPYTEQATGVVRQITVLSYLEGLFSIQEVKEAYPEGIDARDMAWIWRRLLIVLDFAHTHGIIHGGVLPTHILLHPEKHGVVLIDWSYAVRDPTITHTRLSAISAAYRAWYPAEVFARQETQPGLDIFMAGRCMIDLLGGDPQLRTMPESVPWQIQNHLKGCTLPHPQQRPQDVRLLRKEFDELLERLWGPRTFHAFSMPKH